MRASRGISSVFPPVNGVASNNYQYNRKELDPTQTEKIKNKNTWRHGQQVLVRKYHFLRKY